MILSLLLFGSLLLAPAFAVGPPPIKRPGEIITATIEGGNPETVDPAWCYDTASAELIFNVYDTLITFDAEHMETYLPSIATSWTITPITETSPEGLTWYYRYNFTIRSGVKFHDNSILTPQDVEYSFEREMVQDRASGPQWMLYEPLLNGVEADYIDGVFYDLTDPVQVAKVGKMIDHSVGSSSTNVWFNIAFPGSYAPFMQILCQSWSSILSKAWVNSLGRGDWSGNWMLGGDHTEWLTHHLPDVSPLDTPTPVMMGSGPFVFETLDYTAKYWSVSRFSGYWRGWPADFPTGSGPAGYINHLVTTWAYVWETRSAMFLAGDVDFCAVPRKYIGSMVNQDGIRLIWPLPTLACDAIFYTFNINTASTYGPFNPNGVYSETAIPYDFFSNIHVRKAFSYAFDYNTFLSIAYLDEAIQPATAIIPGLPYYDPTVKGYIFNTTRAIEEFKAVPGLWDTGFTITLLYNTDNLPRKTACDLLEAALEGLNSKFHVTVASSDWKPYLRAAVQSKLPVFIIGWLADYPDAHNFAYAFYYSYGAFAAWQGYSNPAMDALIESGIRTPDGPARAVIYHNIQVLAVTDCPSVAIDQAIGRHFERDWIVGWYYNPIYPGLYAYNLWKWYYWPQAGSTNTDPTKGAKQPLSNLLPFDINYDGKIDIRDVRAAAKSFGASYGPPIHPRWLFRCDINNDRKIDIRDIRSIASSFGKESAVWTPP